MNRAATEDVRSPVWPVVSRGAAQRRRRRARSTPQVVDAARRLGAPRRAAARRRQRRHVRRRRPGDHGRAVEPDRRGRACARCFGDLARRPQRRPRPRRPVGQVLRRQGPAHAARRRRARASSTCATAATARSTPAARRSGPWSTRWRDRAGRRARGPDPATWLDEGDRTGVHARADPGHDPHHQPPDVPAGPRAGQRLAERRRWSPDERPGPGRPAAGPIPAIDAPARRRAARARVGRARFELFFDLVFVLGFTQCTALMAADPSWTGLGRGMLVLAVLWWAWVVLCVADERRSTPRRARSGSRCSGPWPGCSSWGSACPRRSVTGRSPSPSPTASCGRPHRPVPARQPRRPRASPLGVGFAVSTAVGVGLLVGASFFDGCARARCGSGRLPRLGRSGGSFGDDGVEARPGALRRTPQPRDHPRPRGVDRRPRRRRRPRLEHRSDRGRGPRHRPCVGGVVDLLRRRRAGHRTTPRSRRRRAASATRWPATPTPTCTSRWWPASCCPPSGSRRRWPTSTNRSTGCPRSPCSAGWRSTCSPTSPCDCATHTPSTANAWRSRSSWSPRAGGDDVDALATLAVVNVLIWAMIAYETFVVYDDRRYLLRHGQDYDEG